ncbi:hypothetical protein [Nocardia carnea]|uniref:hypothetical protein n=1 Tax=Nocardia carnea TaxID=37328 RepID=UPI0024561586|nr:hypothetical protein [Nocardia carnea]
MRARDEITYTDELLADRTVHRRYSDGQQEWRSRGPDGVVSWRDDRGSTGTDEPLGRHLIKRTYGDGRIVYGREAGYGRTLWGDGVLTANRSSFGGRLGGILAAAAGVVLVGSLIAPPESLTPEQEEELRLAAEEDPAAATGGSGEYGEWGGDADTDGDFG